MKKTKQKRILFRLKLKDSDGSFLIRFKGKESAGMLDLNDPTNQVAYKLDYYWVDLVDEATKKQYSIDISDVKELKLIKDLFKHPEYALLYLAERDMPTLSVCCKLYLKKLVTLEYIGEK